MPWNVFNPSIVSLLWSTLSATKCRNESISISCKSVPSWSAAQPSKRNTSEYDARSPNLCKTSIKYLDSKWRCKMTASDNCIGVMIDLVWNFEVLLEQLTISKGYCLYMKLNSEANAIELVGWTLTMRNWSNFQFLQLLDKKSCYCLIVLFRFWWCRL